MGKVEEVAEALWQAEWTRAGSGGKRRVPWTEIAPVDQERWRFLSGAAIAAMREPTEVMLGAMNETTIEAWDGDAFWPAKDDCKSLFNAAIDAALSEDKEQG